MPQSDCKHGGRDGVTVMDWVRVGVQHRMRAAVNGKRSAGNGRYHTVMVIVTIKTSV